MFEVLKRVYSLKTNVKKFEAIKKFGSLAEGPKVLKRFAEKVGYVVLPRFARRSLWTSWSMRRFLGEDSGRPLSWSRCCLSSSRCVLCAAVRTRNELFLFVELALFDLNLVLWQNREMAIPRLEWQFCWGPKWAILGSHAVGAWLRRRGHLPRTPSIGP